MLGRDRLSGTGVGLLCLAHVHRVVAASPVMACQCPWHRSIIPSCVWSAPKAGDVSLPGSAYLLNISLIMEKASPQAPRTHSLKPWFTWHFPLVSSERLPFKTRAHQTHCELPNQPPPRPFTQWNCSSQISLHPSHRTQLRNRRWLTK